MRNDYAPSRHIMYTIILSLLLLMRNDSESDLFIAKCLWSPVRPNDDCFQIIKSCNRLVKQNTY